MRRWLVYLLCGVMLAHLGCSHRTTTEDDKKNGHSLVPVLIRPLDPTQPITIGWTLSSLIRAATDAATPPFMRVDGQDLVIAKAFLGTPLVLLPALTESSLSPEPLLWATTRLVMFQRIDNRLQLVESAQGKQGHTTYRTPQILATFPILNTTRKEIIFDFQAGALSDLLLARPALAHTAAGANATLLGGPPWTKASGSYFRSSAAEDGWFSVEQVVGFSNANIDAAAVFRFTFWQADRSTMKPLLDDPDDDIGYFHITTFPPGHLEPKHIVRRWRTDRPLTFYISANTPQRYRAAIREGVLAWNTVFDGDFLRVADAPAGVQAGDPRYPLIQWIEDEQGLGVGMSQSHPITGEQLTALVTIREGWTQLRSHNHFATPEDPASAIPFQVNGFLPAVQCQHASDGWDQRWIESTAQPLDGPTTDRLAALQLRSVVMHEVGHTLGLRHNFGGSLDNEIPRDIEQADLAAAIAGTRPPTAPLPSSSVMDYLPPPDNIRMTRPGRYDLKAISWAYDNSWGFDADVTTASPDTSVNAMPGPAWTYITDVHFCTDEAVDAIADCAQRDSGQEPLDW